MMYDLDSLIDQHIIMYLQNQTYKVKYQVFQID